MAQLAAVERIVGMTTTPDEHGASGGVPDTVEPITNRLELSPPNDTARDGESEVDTGGLPRSRSAPGAMAHVGTTSTGNVGCAANDKQQGQAPGERWLKGKDLLGKGSFGEVYNGLDQETGKPVAVKVITLDRIESLADAKKEVALLSQLRHPNIVEYLGEVEGNGSLMVAMEYVAGGSLATVLEQFGKLAPGILHRYTTGVLCGLHYLHACKIIHRDVKPANVLLGADGACKLADFGAAKSVQSPAASAVVGTPLYMAPEHMSGNCSLKSDIWSLGVTCLQLATDASPYPDISVEDALFYAVCVDKTIPAVPDWLREDLKTFITACLKPELERPECAKLLLESTFIVGPPGSDPPYARYWDSRIMDNLFQQKEHNQRGSPVQDPEAHRPKTEESLTAPM